MASCLRRGTFRGREPKATATMLYASAIVFCSFFGAVRGYSAEDKAGLLAFRDGGDATLGDAASWTTASEPCDEGWYSREVGWLAVDCNAPGSLGGRVTQLRSVTTGLAGECLLAGDVTSLVQVTDVVTVDLQGCDGVGGPVMPLASLTHLTFLALGGTSVTGTVEPLAELAGLLTLRLAGSSVYGAIAPLRALPGLGESWDDFGACSAHSCLLTRLLGIDALIEGAADYTGADDCTCCTDSCMAIGNAFCVQDLEGSPLPVGYVTRPTWTPWLSRDTGDGYGDNEGPGADWACPDPVDIQCETVVDGIADGIVWNETGQVFKAGCTTSGGLVCFNSHNQDACLDYRIRLLCPATHNDRVRLGDVACDLAYSGSSPGAECAEDSPAFNLTGCEENTCDALTEIQRVGYELANPAGTSVTDLSNVTCAAGYTNATGYSAGPLPEYLNGTVVATGPVAVCAEDGGVFELKGCRENICESLTEETLAGYVVVNSSARTVLSLSNVSCAFGYNNPIPSLPSYTPPIAGDSGSGSESSSWSGEDDPALLALLVMQAAIDSGVFQPAAECAIDGGEFELTGCIENNCTAYDANAVLGEKPWSPQKYQLQFPQAVTVLGLGIVRCGFGYHGEAVAACPRDNGTFNPLDGCIENVCGPFPETFNATSWNHGGEQREGPVAGYIVANWPFDLVPNVTNATNTSNATYSFVPGVTVTELGPVSCADGFHGSAVAACPVHSGSFSPLRGCDENVCTRFSETFLSVPTGYTVEQVNSTTVTGLGRLGCAFGYHGTAVATCAEHRGTFANLTGCEENVCDKFSTTFPVMPVGTPGTRPIYTVPNIAGSRMTELGPLTCASGYHGVAVSACAVHNEKFDPLSGCWENQCARFVETFPAAPIGYVVPNWNGTNVTDIGSIACDVGYSAFNPVTECLTHQGMFTVEGCVESLCKAHTEEELHERGYDSATDSAVNVSGLGTLACHSTHFQTHRTIMPSAACYTNETTSGMLPFQLDGCMAKDYLHSLAATVIMTLTLDGNMTDIANISDRGVFETALKHNVVDLLDISINRILILNITAGSIEVECMLLPDLYGRPISDSKILSSLPRGVPIAGYGLLEAPYIFRCTGTTSCDVDVLDDGFLRVDCECTPAPIPPPPPPWTMPLWMLLAIIAGSTLVCCLVSWRIRRRWKNRIRPGDPYKWENGVKIYVPPPPELPQDIKIAPGTAFIDYSAPLLGSGRYADIRCGQYTFDGKDSATDVSFRVLRDAQPLSYGQSLYEETRDFPCTRSQTALSELRRALRPGVHHRNVMKIYGVWELPDRADGTYPVAVVEELMPGLSLRNVLDDKQGFPELGIELRLRWLTEIAEGMAALHDISGTSRTGLVHRDLKCANILLSSTNIATATVKIGGHGVIVAEQHCVGTHAWKAPEAFQPIVVLSEEADGTGIVDKSRHALAGALNFLEAKTGLDIDGDGDVGEEGDGRITQVSYRFSQKSDVFSFAVVGFEVVTRLIPWADLSEVEIKKRVMAMFDPHSKQATHLANLGFSLSAQMQDWLRDNPLDDRRLDLTAGDGKSCPNTLAQFIQRGWADSPEERPTFLQCVKELKHVAATMVEVPPPAKYVRTKTVLSSSERSFVCKANNLETGRPIAAKQHTHSERFNWELQNLRRLSGGGARNVVVQLDGVDEASETLFLEMADKTLKDYMDEHRKGMDERELRMWMKKVLTVLDFMHNNAIAHNDVKPENLFVFSSTQKPSGDPEPGLHPESKANTSDAKQIKDGQASASATNMTSKSTAAAAVKPGKNEPVGLKSTNGEAVQPDLDLGQLTQDESQPEVLAHSETSVHVHSELVIRTSKEEAVLKIGDMQSAAAFHTAPPTQVTAYVCPPELARHIRSEAAAQAAKTAAGNLQRSSDLLAGAVNFLEAKTGLDLDGDGDVGEEGEEGKEDNLLPNAVVADDSLTNVEAPSRSRRAFAGAVNFLEAKTGLDIDGDGDVGEEGCAPSAASKLVVDDKGDIWAIGVLAYYLRTGLKPFVVDERANTLVEQLRDIALLSQDDVNRTIALNSAGASNSSSAFEEFLGLCLALDPRHRANTAQLLDCEWISGITAEEKARHEKERQLWEMFDKYDEDGSGLLDNDELMILLEEEFDYAAGDRAIDAVIEDFDKDGDGNIDKQEFLGLWDAVEQAAGAGSESASLWYEDADVGSQQQLSLVEAGRKLTDGSLTELTEVWMGGMEGWCRLADARSDPVAGPLLNEQMPAHLKHLHKETTYVLTVVTSDVRGAGTNAKVFVSLFGDHGEVGERRLPSKRKHFERKREDIFRLPEPKGKKCKEIGTLQRLVVRHDGSGMGAGWHLDRIDVRSERSGRAWSFYCNQWLDKSQGDKLIERELYAAPLFVPQLDGEHEGKAKATVKK